MTGRFRLFAALPALIALAAPAGAQTYTWTTGASGNWNSTGWTSGTAGVGPPPGTANATISAAGTYTVTVSDARTIGALTLGGANATLAVSGGSLTVNGAFALNNGTLDTSAGTATLNGAFNWGGGTVGPGALTAANGGTITGGTVSTGGLTLGGSTQFNWTSGAVKFLNGGGLTVASGATLYATTGSGFSVTGTATVQNNGTIEKAGGTGEAVIPSGVTLNNAGTLRATAGGFNIQGGTVTNTGTVDINPAAEVFVNAGTLNLNAGSTVTGGGAIRVDASGGTLAVNAAVTSAGGLKYVRGLVTGSGSLTLAGAFDFGLYDSNSLTGLTVNANAGGNWNGTGTPRIGTAAVNLTGGTVTWGGSNVTFTAGGALTVAPGATLNLVDDKSISVSAGSPTVTINGTLTKSAGTGSSTIAAAAALTVGPGGLIDVQSGTLYLPGNVTNNGTIKATSAIDLNAASTISGSGTLSVPAGGTLAVNPSSSTTTTVSTGTFTNAGTVQVTSGALKVAAATALTNYAAATNTLTGGTWLATDAAINLDGRTIQTIATGTTVELSGSAASVTGLTALTQNNGQLRLVSGATLTPLAAVNNAGVIEASGTFGAPVVVQPGGVLTGGGVVNGAVTVQSGGKVSPGPGPYAAPGVGVLTTGTTAASGGGRYVWELNSWSTSASAGNTSAGFDQLKGLSGVKLNLAGASAANPFVVAVTSLNGSAAGLIPDYDPSVARTWVIADFSTGNATNGVQNFSADRVALDTSAFLNDANTGRFSVAVDAASDRLLLTYTPVPEPALGVVAAAAGLAAVGRRRAPGQRR